MRIKVFILCLALALFLLILPRLVLGLVYQGKIYSQALLLKGQLYHPWVLVLGAGVREDGKASNILFDRVKTAAELYHQGLSTHFLMSGAIHPPQENEPKAMKEVALALGLPKEVIFLDGEAFNTRQNCENAAQVFKLKQAIVVSQAFHLPRALWLCEAAGIEVIALATPETYGFKSRLYYEAREVLATWKALLERL
ncbi:MAG: YdcF family protein [Deltaproteobacteria bacterium]|nr:YdcF family protein [Deltaproteobacteria bacterium]